MAGSSRYHMCTICAVRLYDYDTQATYKGRDPPPWQPGAWRASVVALAGPTWPFESTGPESMKVPDEIISRHQAFVYWDPAQVYIGGERICLQDENSPGEQEAYNPDHYILNTDKRCYLAVHAACEDIAQRVMAESWEARIRSTGDLWMTLERRIIKTSWDETIFPPFLPNVPERRPGRPTRLGLRGYYIPGDAIPGEQPGYDDSVEEWWLDDPLHIQNLTTSILSNLQPAEPVTAPGRCSEFENLPTEIRDEIVPLLTTQPVALECNYSIPQVYWKQALPQVPFLWDLDMQIIIEKSREVELEGIEWDWEKLVRQLMIPVTTVDEKNPWIQGRDEEDEEEDGKYGVSNPIPWSYAQVGLVVPPGLNNRRRIWQILEEMYPNDVGMSHLPAEDPESE